MKPNVTVREAARILRVTPRTIRNWVAEGKLMGNRVSERVMLIPLSEVDRLAGVETRPDLSSVIWDVDLSTLDEVRHSDFIMRRVLDAGRPDQVRWLFLRYGEDAIVEYLERDRALPHRRKVGWTELLRRRRERTA
ncbi:MAG: helix-turn-helix domain-containing protein [Actinomycetota bacterium]|nr:helix-turn-helix domain-containing protein [Actinomycetota bacterium]